jgi:peptidyl-tRNA hydrolase, PTH1 family
MTTFTLVPLGNPGLHYAKTRHNIARILLSLIKEEVMAISACEIMIPDTFMNDSGRAVVQYLKYHEGRELIVMYDDKDLAYGTFRISYDRGDGGHNGLKSIIESLGKKDFIRIRIGIGPQEEGVAYSVPIHGDKVQSYVMGNVTESEEVSLRSIAPHVLSSIRTIVEHGYMKAMEVYNGQVITR